MTTAEGIKGDDILATLLSGLTGEDRERLRLAHARFRDGDPDSIPALLALADRFSLAAHAELVIRAEEALARYETSLLPSIERAVQNAEKRIEASADQKIAQLAAAFDSAKTLPGAVQTVIGHAERATKDLKAATRAFANVDGWRNLVFLSLMAIGVAALGFWFGSVCRGWHQAERFRGLLHRSDLGDTNASGELWNEIQEYRTRNHLKAGENQAGGGR